MTWSLRSLAFVVAALSITCGEPASADKRALVIGIDDYQNVTKLKNAAYDATKFAEQMNSFGYKTILLTNEKANRQGIILAWQKLLDSLKENDEVVLFYSGHGVEIEGANYIVPTDSPSGDDLQGSAALKLVLLSLPSLVSDLNKKPLGAMIWILDACRNNPFVTAGKAIGASGGLVNMEGPPGTFIFYSANFGQTALDRLRNDPPTERNSIYTRTLLKAVQSMPTAPAWDLAREIKPVVRSLASQDAHDQRPAYYDGLDKPWCFVRCQSDSIQSSFQTATRNIEQPTQDDIVKTAVVAERALAPNFPPNAIFLGKKSSIENCSDSSPATYPFGCDVLKMLVESKDTSKALLGRPLTVQTAVNVRKRAPTVQEKAGAIYGCVVDTLKEGDTATLTGILNLSYAGDIFYWGTLDQTPKDCRHS